MQHFKKNLLCIAILLFHHSINAQTFSLAFQASFYISRYVPAKNGDYFFCGALSNYHMLYCARISSTGEVRWEKIFPVSEDMPWLNIQGTLDDGVVIFSKDNADNGEHYGLLTKVGKDGSVQWAKRFQVGDNLLITPADVQESADNDIILLYDVVESDLFATERPQLAVFSKFGKLLSQSGIKPFPLSRGNNYFSHLLTLAENGDYMIVSRVDYVDYEYNSWPKIIRISRDTNITPTYTALYTFRFYDSWWPGAVLEKDGRVFMKGGYSAYKYYPNDYVYLSSYISFDADDVTSTVKFMTSGRFLDQKLVNDGTLPFGFHRLLKIEKDGSMISLGYASDHITMDRYNAAGQTCPAYETPVIDSTVKMEPCTISKSNLPRGIDSITTLTDYHINIRDTTITILTCSGAPRVSIKTVSKIVTSNAQTNKLYPNPVHDFAMLDLTMPATGAVHIQLTSADGKILQTTKETLCIGNYKRKIIMSGVAPGIYFLQLFYGNNKVVFKIIKT